MTDGAVRSYAVALLLAVSIGVPVGIGSYTFWYGRGYSYLSDDPAACVNCHIMRDNYDSWSVSSHRSVTCNGCHVPHDLAGKYVAKMEHGLRHSAAFTFGDVQVIQITPKSLSDVQHNCVRCHEPTVAFVLPDGDVSERFCTRCHRGAGHVS